MTDWTRFTIRLEALRRQAQADVPTRPASWGPLLDRALERIGRVAASSHATAADVVLVLDGEIRFAQNDIDPYRGAWREEKLLTLKVHLLDPREIEALDRLAAEVAASMAAAQGLPA